MQFRRTVDSFRMRSDIVVNKDDETIHSRGINKIYADCVSHSVMKRHSDVAYC